MSEPTIPCPRCDGSGHAALDKALHDALDALRAGTPATSQDIHHRLQTTGYRSTPTATMTSLAKLVRAGLVIRRGKQGRSWLYRLPHETTPTV